MKVGYRPQGVASERRRGEVVDPLNRATDSVFRAALAFFRWKRGVGEKAQDVSTFFKRRKLSDDFSRYWSSSRNAGLRQAFRKRLKDVAAALSES
jgi:hypothetical protein